MSDSGDEDEVSSSSSSAINSTIQVYARLRPSPKLAKSQITLDPTSSRIEFRVPKESASGYINNKKEIYEFKFNQLFDTNTKQEEIFEQIAKPVVDSVLEGYNGTIFAYVKFNPHNPTTRHTAIPHHS